MTELRRRMDDDMVARGFADRTRESYLWAVTGLARFYRRSPDRISDAEVQAYVVHLLRDRQRSWSTCNVVANGLRFFFHTTLKRDRTTFTIMTLEADEFLRRFLLHVVPPGFMRIRHFGLLANRTRRETLTRCRRLLGQPSTHKAPPESVGELMHRLTGIDMARCPVCGEGRMQVTAIVVRVLTPDTS